MIQENKYFPEDPNGEHMSNICGWYKNACYGWTSKKMLTTASTWIAETQRRAGRW